MAKGNPLIKPYLKWAGGKRQLLPEIKKHFPENLDSYTYYEPFIGAGAVFFELQPKKAIINDFNTQLILTYTVIKDNVEELVGVLKNYQDMNDEESFYTIRNVDRDTIKFNTLTNVEKAARLIFLNKTCFNGLYRVNSQGLFNVPYGRYKNPAVCEEIVLRQISDYLNANEIDILNNDFEYAVINADKQSFVYLDPPYHSPHKTSFTGYQADGFGEDEQERLRNVIIKMTNRGAKCLLSNSDTEYIRELYKHDFFDIISVQAKRAINSDSSGRGNVNEVLIKNWKE
ncbi:site-specific DNA-methyltransferase (adenine-specific) [Spirochaetia bacterium]|nr:site-specific DNA-methyltransferase (adenine-specific) [Spirochaetia bacterium]